MNRILAALALVCALASSALAGTACPQHFLGGIPPATASAGTELCNDAFAVLWSPGTRDPVYAAEHLTAASLSTRIKREGAFYADLRLAPDGALLSDYRGQRIWDRGHMAPAHDMPTPLAMRQSFALSNMVPQSKSLNRGAWAQIEEAVRTLVVSKFDDPESDLADRGGWVVTGPIFDGEPKRLHGRVAIPSRLFKTIYVPGDQFGNAPAVGAWIVRNAVRPETRFVSIAALAAEAGIDPFPGLPSELRDKVLLPPGVARRTGVARGH